MFNRLCNLLTNENFWKEFKHPEVKSNTLRYYISAVKDRTLDIAKEKGIPEAGLDELARCVALSKFRIFCEKYYREEKYTEDDIKNEGSHLYNVTCALEYIALQLGSTQENLNDLRLAIDIECTEKLFSDVLPCEATAEV
jgi:hypothetical protein